MPPGGRTAGDLGEGGLRVVDVLEGAVAEDEVGSVAADEGRQGLGVALHGADPRRRLGLGGAAAQGGEGVRAGVDDRDVVPGDGERDGESAGATPEVDDPQRALELGAAGAHDLVDGRPHGGGPG